MCQLAQRGLPNDRAGPPPLAGVIGNMKTAENRFTSTDTVIRFRFGLWAHPPSLPPPASLRSLPPLQRLFLFFLFIVTTRWDNVLSRHWPLHASLGDLSAVASNSCSQASGRAFVLCGEMHPP